MEAETGDDLADDDDLTAHRDRAEEMLPQIAQQAKQALAQHAIDSSLFFLIPNSSRNIRTFATTLDPDDDEWERISEIVEAIDLATLSCMMSCAAAWDYIDANPVKQFSKRHIRESQPRTAYPNGEQIDELVACSAYDQQGDSVPGRDWHASGGSLLIGVVAGIDPAPRGQADQDEDLKPTGGAIERCRTRHTDRHTSASHLTIRVLARRRSAIHQLCQQLRPGGPTSRSAVPVPRSAPRLCQHLPTGHRGHPRATGDPRPQDDRDDHAVRPHRHQPPLSSDSRVRR